MTMCRNTLVGKVEMSACLRFYRLHVQCLVTRYSLEFKAYTIHRPLG